MLAMRRELDAPLPSFDDPGRDPRTLILLRRYPAAAIRLPPLPAGIEYQRADGALILWDRYLRSSSLRFQRR